MELKNKIISGLVTLVIAGAGVSVGVDNACIDENGVTMFPAEELVLREIDQSSVVDSAKEVGTICFQSKSDYETYRDDRIDTYLSKSEKDRELWKLTGDGQTLDDVLTHEIEKLGKISFPVKEGEDIFLLIINKLKL